MTQKNFILSSLASFAPATRNPISHRRRASLAEADTDVEYPSTVDGPATSLTTKEGGSPAQLRLLIRHPASHLQEIQSRLRPLPARGASYRGALTLLCVSVDGAATPPTPEKTSLPRHGHADVATWRMTRNRRRWSTLNRCTADDEDIGTDIAERIRPWKLFRKDVLWSW
jgi:hypothetical protein